MAEQVPYKGLVGGSSPPWRIMKKSTKKAPSANVTIRRARIALLKDLVMALDYDIYKGIFEIPEDEDMAADTVEELLNVLAKHGVQVNYYQV